MGSKRSSLYKRQPPPPPSAVPIPRLRQGRIARRDRAYTLLSAALIVICLTAPTQAAGIWRRALGSNPASLDPHKATTVVESDVLNDLYEGLLVYDGEGKLQPGVAERWEISADKRVYTFHLRGDARWSNGDPVVAEDFVFALHRLMDPKTGAPYANVLYPLKNARAVNTGALPIEKLGARAIDPRTLELTLEAPTPYLLELLTHSTAMPLHRASFTQWGDGFVRPGRLVSNGAFVLKSYRPNDRLVLDKSAAFHDAAHVALDGEIVYPIEDQAAALRRFMAGEIDSYDSVPVEQIGFVRAHLGRYLKVAPYLGTNYYDFDTRQKPFDDVRVRTALSMVIDREFIARRIAGGTKAPAYSFVPPGIESYGTPSMVTWKDMSPFDREDEAKRLMKAAGYGPGHPLRLTMRYSSKKETAIAIADMWRVLGVETEFVVSDFASLQSVLQGGASFDVAQSGWFADYPDAQNYLFLAESDNRALNYSHFADKDFDALMQRAATEADEIKRRAILHEAEALLLAKSPVIPLMIDQAPNLVSDRLHGWTANVLDHHPARYVSKDP